MPEHETFYAIRQTLEDGRVIVTVTHEVPEGAVQLGAFATPGEAIDCAQAAARGATGKSGAVEYVEPPDDLVGTG